FSDGQLARLTSAATLRAFHSTQTALRGRILLLDHVGNLTGSQAYSADLAAVEITKKRSSQLICNPSRRNVFIETCFERTIDRLDAVDPEPNPSSSPGAVEVFDLHCRDRRDCRTGRSKQLNDRSIA